MIAVNVFVSDGVYRARKVFQIVLTQYKPDATFKFVYETYNSTLMEDVKSAKTVRVVNPIGYIIGQQLHFRLLNPTPIFEIGEISGVLRTKTNASFDSETTPFYIVHIEASTVYKNKKVVARTTVNVTIGDVNDNAPVFSAKKYYRAVDIDMSGSTDLLQVFATDADSGENAKIR